MIIIIKKIHEKKTLFDQNQILRNKFALYIYLK